MDTSNTNIPNITETEIANDFFETCVDKLQNQIELHKREANRNFQKKNERGVFDKAYFEYLENKAIHETWAFCDALQIIKEAWQDVKRAEKAKRDKKKKRIEHLNI